MSKTGTNKKDWIAFICTNPDLSEEEIIRIYGKRWKIEVFFKTRKSYLKLLTECHSLSYDALTCTCSHRIHESADKILDRRSGVRVCTHSKKGKKQ